MPASKRLVPFFFHRLLSFIVTTATNNDDEMLAELNVTNNVQHVIVCEPPLSRLQ